MSKPILVDLFVEDRAHEELLKPLINRIAAEKQVSIQIRIRSSRGGHNHAITEFKLYQKAAKGLADDPADLLVVGIDGNCSTSTKKREEIRKATTPLFIDRLVVACPDPHVERWYLGDPESFHSVVGYQPSLESKKCERGYYKQALRDAIRLGGQPAMLGGIEYASELVDKMDLYKAGKNSHCLKAFIDDFREKLHNFSASS